MHLHLHLHLLLLLLLFIPSPSHSSDLRSLLEFKKGIVSDASGLVLSSWVPPPSDLSCPNSFHGVVCDLSGSSVIGISLSGLGLAGELKLATLSSLKSLRNLSLSNNSLSGRLVPSLGSITTLQLLDLSSNRFYGPVPARITELWGLTHLNLSHNHLTGGIPAGFQNLQQLRTLDLSSNGLWGDVGQSLSELRNVELLDLSSNGFYGAIALEPGNFSLGNTVRYMNLSGNNISGEFFSSDSIAMFRTLEVLDVSGNQIGGQLPKLEPLTNLRVFKAGNNRLFGPVPVELFGNGMPLLELHLNANGFSGSVGSINSTTLKVLNLSSNSLVGSLPASLGSCTTVDMSKNMLSGDLFVMQEWKDTLEVIDLSSNTVSGSFPNNTALFGSLISIKIQNNSLAGVLPAVLGTYPRLTTLDLSLNELTGLMLPSLLTSPTLTSLNLSGNHFTGSIQLQSLSSADSTGMTSHSPLEILDLSDNEFSGLLPPEVSNMKSLRVLNLRKNTLSGELPVELSTLGGLEVLDLSVNHFKGRIPEMPQPRLMLYNVSYNELSGVVPQTLERFPESSFHPGNSFLVFADTIGSRTNNTEINNEDGHRRRMKSSIQVAFIVGCVGAVVLIIFFFMAFYKIRSQEFCGRNGFGAQTFGRDVKQERFSHPDMFTSQKDDTAQISTSYSNAHLLTSTSRSMCPQRDLMSEMGEYGYSDPNELPELTKLDAVEHHSPKSPLPSSPLFTDTHSSEQPVVLDVYSPDRFVGELLTFDRSLVFTAEELSQAPAEVLGRSSHGTSYKATLCNGHVLTVKWLRVGLVKHKKDFIKEAKILWSIRHPNIVPLRGYYWGRKEQERLIISDYIEGDSLALYLYESTPRRYSRLTVSERLKIAIDVARSLCYLHDEKNLPHGGLKPTNIILGLDFTARLTDFALHRFMTPSGTAEQMLNLGALGYRAPELATAAKPLPTFKADVYAFGVILMELLTRKSAGDIISGQPSAVDLTDWVRVCYRDGRGAECFDRDIAGLEGASKAMEELLALSLTCILPVTERPNMRAVLKDLCSIEP
ncbi:putative protein kinase RLK-Pelle-LRR-III family [Dioscorea sansibarensis]